MKQVEKIWAELSANASTELSAEKVELGLVEDFEKIYKSVVDADADIADSIVDVLIKAENKYKTLISDFERAAKIGSDAEAAAKELGVDLPSAFQNKVEITRRAFSDRKSTRLNSSHVKRSRMPSSA